MGFDLADIFTKESKARVLARDVPLPNPWGIFSLVNGFAGFGAKMADYNVALRASYYDTLAAENTLLNNSALSHFGSPYWAEM